MTQDAFQILRRCLRRAWGPEVLQRVEADDRNPVRGERITDLPINAGSTAVPRENDRQDVLRRSLCGDLDEWKILHGRGLYHLVRGSRSGNPKERGAKLGQSAPRCRELMPYVRQHDELAV